MRIVAFDSDDNRFTLSVDGLSLDKFEDAHLMAAKGLQSKMGWSGTLIGGGTKDGNVFVFLPDELARAIIRADYWLEKLLEVKRGDKLLAECSSLTGIDFPEDEIKEAVKLIKLQG